MKAKRIISLLLVLCTLFQLTAGVSAATPTAEQEHLHTHAEVPRGDMDENGRVDVADAVYLLRAVLLPDTYPLHQAGDMDGDKDIDVADALYLLRHVLLPDKYPLSAHTHDPHEVNGKEATCTEAGATDGVVCATCGVTISGCTPIPAKGHVAVVSERISATCTTDGHVIKHCAVCETDFVAETTYAKGHSYGEAQELAAPTCTKAGASLETCSICQNTKETAVPATGHSFTVMGTEGETITYTCEICGESTTDIAASDPIVEEHVYDCGDDYTFTVESDLPADTIRDRLQIIDAFFADTAYESHADAAFPFLLESQGNGLWQVKPNGAYEKGTTYRVRVGEGVTLTDHPNGTFFFTVKDEVHTQVTAQQGIIFIVLPQVGTPDRDRYILLTETENDRIYLTMPQDGRVGLDDRGKIVCAGAYRSMDEIMQDNTKECYFGKIEEIYPITDGRLTLVLTCPELDEIFSELDTYAEEQLSFTEEELPEDLRENAVDALLVSEDFNEFLASVTIAAESYATEKGLYAAGVADKSFLQDLTIKPSLTIQNGDTLVLKLEGKLPIKLKDDTGKAIGTVTVSFSTVCEFSFKVSAACEIKKFMGIPTGLKEFDFEVTQSSKYAFSFSVTVGLKEIHNDPSTERRIVKTSKGTYHLDGCMLVANMDKDKLINCSTASLDAEYRKNGGHIEGECGLCRPFMSYLRKKVYVVNNDTKGVHRFICSQADRVAATATTVTMEAPVHGGYTLCDYCFGGAEEEMSEEDNFIAKMGESLQYTNWSDLVQSVRDKVCGNKKQESAQKAIPLVDKPIPFLYVLSVNIHVDMVIEIQFTGSFSAKYESSTTTVTGMRKTADGALEPTFSRTQSKSVSSLQVIGTFDVKAGVRLQVTLSFIGLEKFIHVGLSAQIGAYSELDGVLHLSQTTVSDGSGTDTTHTFYAAAYWEMGIYINITFDYRLFFWGDNLSLLGGEKRFPILALGYDKVYYGYSATTDLLELVDTKEIDLAAYNMLRVNGMNIKDQKGFADILDINGEEGLYTVSIRVLDEDGKESPFATARNGKVFVAQNAPCDLRLTVEVQVKGARKPVASIADFFKEGYISTPLYQLPLYVFDLRVQNHTISEWAETKAPTCTEEGEESRHATCDCVDIQTRSIPALGHSKETLKAVKETCTTTGLTEGSHCPRCYEVFVAQQVIPALGHSYAYDFTCSDRACLRTGCDHIEPASTDHRFGDWMEAPQNGCTDVNYSLRFCQDCGFAKNSLTDGELILELHDPSPVERQNPTCDEDGFLRCYCLRCEVELNYMTLPARGHELKSTFNDEGHFEVCERFDCDYQSAPKPHSYTYLCDASCNGCDYVRDADHKWETTYTDGPTSHYYKCETCNTRRGEESHVYDHTCDTQCNVCGHKRDITHRWSETYTFHATGHWKVCSVCSATTTVTGHDYENDCDATCADCGYIRDTDHRWQTTYTATPSGHYIACSRCNERKDAGAHVYEDDCDEVCNICAHTREISHNWGTTRGFDGTHHWNVCADCGTLSGRYVHTFDNLCDATCNDCAHTRPVAHVWQETYSVTETTHYYACDNCSARKDEAAHVYDDGCDVDCNICGDKRGVEHLWGDYVTDGTHHWKVCETCGDTTSKTAHSGGSATCDVAAVCAICHASYGDLRAHKWSDYTQTETEHLRRCEYGCGAVETVPHSFTDFTVTDPTCTTDGYKTRRCTVCDYVNTQAGEQATGHDWASDYTQSETAHWIDCARCDAIRDKASHSYDSLCTACDVCGYVRREDHVWSDTYQKDAGGHWQVCVDCDAASTAVSHVYDHPCDTLCDVCGYTRTTAGHQWQYLSDATHHWQQCRLCPAEGAKQPHDGTATCELGAICSVCGVTHATPLGHNWKSAYTQTETEHFIGCTRCEATKDTGAHSFGTDYAHDITHHWRTCTVCGYVSASAAHRYDNACDTACNDCGRTRSVSHDWSETHSFDITHHWRTCTVCGVATGKIPHSGGTATCTKAAECTVCRNPYGSVPGHNWETAYTADNDGHWFGCTRCNEKQSYGVHGGGEATCTKRAVCLICGTAYGDLVPHSYTQQKATDTYAVKKATCTAGGTYRLSCICGKSGTGTFAVSALGHDWNDTYSHSDTQHWYGCSRCTATQGQEAHIGGTATCQKRKTCTECGVEYGSLGGHDFSVKSNEYKAANATCTAAAKYYYTCAVCGIKGSTTYSSGASLGHDFKATYTSATGGHYRGCSRCTAQTDNGPHTFGAPETVIPATCTTGGRERTSCTVCGFSRLSAVEALGHKMSTEKKLVTEEVVKGGVVQYIHHDAFYCEREGCEYFEAIYSAVAHAHATTKLLVGTPATCTEAGLGDGVACAVCDLVRIPQESIPALGHNFVNNTCTRCGAQLEPATEGLLYELSTDGTYYIVTGLAYTCTDTDIIIPKMYNGKPVREIRRNAFAGYTFTSVQIGENITAIGNNAFSGCVNLTTIRFNAKSVADLPDNNGAFLRAGSAGSGITVYFGEQVTKVPANLFCPDYGYGEPGNYANPKITKILFDRTGVCTTIGEDAFRYLHELTEVQFAPSVTHIGSYAFNTCDALKELTLVNGLTHIGDSAFSGCRALATLTLPPSLTTLENGAFQNAYALKNIYFNAENMNDLAYSNDVFRMDDRTLASEITVTVGNGVKRIPACLFDSMYEDVQPIVKNLVFASGSVCSEIGECAFIGCYDLQTLQLPASVKTIGRAAFSQCRSLKTVSLPESLTTMGEDAFAWCYALESVTLPGSLTHIPAYAFYECTGLTSVVVSEGVKEIGEEAFWGCTALKTVTLPQSLTTIGEGAFDSCTSIAKVYYGGTAADWEKITIGNANTYLTRATRYYGFHAPSKGLQFTLSTDGTYYSVSKGSCTDEKVVIPATYNGLPVKEIDSDAFRDYTGLTEITIPESVTTIGNYAFDNCTGLTEITIPDSVTTIGTCAFDNCTGLTEITIPDSVTTIGKYAFYNCTGLETIHFNATNMNDLADSNYVFSMAGQNGNGITVHIGANVQKIPKYFFCPRQESEYAPKVVRVVFAEGSVCESIGMLAFKGCTGLTEIMIPDSVTTIGTSAFCDCTDLTEITIPDSVITIGNGAFSNCTGLTEITIPDSVITIGNGAFDSCTGLQTIHFNATNANDLAAGNYAFYKAGQNGNGITVHIGANVKKIPAYLFYPYSGAACDPKVVRVAFAEGSVCESVGNYAFYGCAGLTEITIPDSVTTIGKYAFYNCTGLETIHFNATNMHDLASSSNAFYKAGHSGNGITVYIGANVQKIPAYLFSTSSGTEHAPKVVRVAFAEDSVCESIGAYAFAYCTGLTEITIPDSVTTIGKRAFYYCSGLTEITIPKSVTTIGEYAFDSCTSIAKVYYGGTAADWGKITIGNANTYLTRATRYYYSATKPTVADGNRYWRYVDGKPVAWA